MLNRVLPLVCISALMSLYLHVCLFMSIYQSVCLNILLYVCISLRMCVYLYVYLCICLLSVYLSLCLYIYQDMCVYRFAFVYYKYIDLFKSLWMSVYMHIYKSVCQICPCVFICLNSQSIIFVSYVIYVYMQVRLIGNTNWRGRLRTIGLLIKVACFVKKVNYIFNIKMNWSQLVSTRRSTVLSCSIQYVFPSEVTYYTIE
jgi:hypothetical protein